MVFGILLNARRRLRARFEWETYEQVYGSVGAVVAVLTWGYVSSLVLLFGAQLTGVFHREQMEHPVPASGLNVPSASYS